MTVTLGVAARAIAAGITLGPQSAHPRGRPFRQIGMVFLFPSGVLALQELQQFLPPHLAAGGFDQESAAPGGDRRGRRFPAADRQAAERGRALYP